MGRSFKVSATAVVALLAPLATAILVASNSPCSQECGNVLDSTSGNDLTCGSYASAAGQVFEPCVTCELGSTYTSSDDNLTDTEAAIYNLRATLAWCVFDFPNNPSAGDNPCVTSFACGNLADAIQYNKTTGPAYEYCNSWDEDAVSGCSICLSALSDNGQYLQNFFTVLDAGCEQKPAAGVKLGIEGNIFSNQPVTITSPSLGNGASAPDYGPVSLGARVGIAFGSLAFLLVVAGFCVVCLGKRRRRRFLRELEKRCGGPKYGWPGEHNRDGKAGGRGTPDVFETPLSQKPLRGWENESPVSAQTEDTQHFSQYSSQYTSPVSATGGTAGTEGTLAEGAAADGVVWPYPPPPTFAQRSSPVQEKASQEQLYHGHDSETLRQKEAPSPMTAVGVALKGSDPSLGSKVSDMSLDGGAGRSPSSSKGKQRPPQSESYELHEVQDSAGGGRGGQGGGDGGWRPQANNQVPVLSHPGYGRQNSWGDSGPGKEGFF